MDAILKERVRIVLVKLEIALGYDARSRSLRGTPNIDRAQRVLDDFRESISEPDNDEEGTPLEMLGLQSKTCGYLYSAGITSIEQLAAMSDEQLMKVDQIRAGRLQEIRVALTHAGL